MKKNRAQNGFTLIELLVVIAIIGLLSSMSVVSLNSARVKARDAMRKADMVQLRTALNLYYDDHNEYPRCGDLQDDPANETTVECYQSLSSTISGGSKPYVGSLPVDPKNANSNVYKYASSQNGDRYALTYDTEDSTDASPQVIIGW